MGEHFINALYATVVNNKIICTGFYSDTKDRRSSGICFFEFDPEKMQVTAEKYNPFSEQFMIDKYGRNTSKELKALEFKKLTVTANGNYIFNAEENWVERVSRTGGADRTITYHFDDIVCAKLDAGGNLIWARNINKMQSSEHNTSHLSYTSAVNLEDTYIFINSGSKINRLSKDRIEFEQAFIRNWSVLNIIKVDANGDIAFEEIPDDGNKILYRVGTGSCTDRGAYFLGHNGGNKQILKVSFP